MTRIPDVLIALLIPCSILLHLFIAPYSKVEESFNLQAVHDILTHGIPFRNVNASLANNYDHVTFSGSVPKTFVAPLALAAASWPISWLVHGVDRQILVRAILGASNAFSIIAFRNAVFRAFGRGPANWYMLFQAGQFHVMFYASRTLPNFFAFGLCTLALRNLFPPKVSLQNRSTIQSRTVVAAYQYSLVILTIVGVVVRSEIAILLGTHTIWLYVRGRLLFKEIVASGMLGLLIGLGLSVPIDSFFWQKFPMWAELSGFIFNVYHGQSSNWGTSPFYYYILSAIPKILLNPLALVCFAFTLVNPVLRTTSLDILIPNAAFVIIYSFHAHKEWRFVVYVIPPLTAIAALGADWIWNRRTRSSLYHLTASALVFTTLASITISFGMLAISGLNYPGAHALNQLHAIADGSQAIVNVHMDTLSCMTGITRFLEIPGPNYDTPAGGNTLWIYDKTDQEFQLLRPEFWDKFDYVLAEHPEKAIGAWEVVDIVYGFSGVGLLRPEDSVGVGKASGQAPASLEGWFKKNWNTFSGLARRWITRGWWVQLKMDPKIWILKSGKRETVSSKKS